VKLRSSMQAVLSAVLAFASTAAPGEGNDERPALLYSLNVKSETVDYGSLGLVVRLVGEAYRKSHERFLAALQSTTQSGAENLLHPFACLNAAEVTAPCRHMVESKEGLADEKLAALLGAQTTRAARVAEVSVIFDGRFFQVPVRLYEAKLNDAGEIIRSQELRATYIRTYSIMQHREDIETNRNESPFQGKFGSKEARMHFWLGGSRPRLTQELQLAVDLLAQLWGASQAPGASGALIGDYSQSNLLPQVKDLAAKETKQCKTLHGNFLVVRELQDHLWLIMPSKDQTSKRVFFIEPRCGFDY
jgi:hypothetical protein